MSVTFLKLDDVNRDHVLLTEKLWLTADRNGVVPDGDDRAAFLLGTPGKKILKSEAERLGILPTGEADVAEDPNAGDDTPEFYEDMTVEQLKDILRERDLTVTGTKDELIARIVEDDQASDDTDGDGDTDEKEG